jgi:Ni/Co efflux regulator RcnB
MLKSLLSTVVLVTALVPAAANASTRCREARHDQQVTGTVLGAIAGGLLGNAVSHGGGRTGGTVIGAVGGAVIGNQLASSSGRPCPDGFEAYDDGVRADQVPPPQYGAPEPYRSQDGERRVWTHPDGPQHDWDRATFDREWGARGADWDHRWERGDRLPDGYATDRRYVVEDYRDHNLDAPRRGYHWVRYGRGFALVRRDGYVTRYIRDDER